jgi:RNA polymerase-binding transcription factor DksA
MQDDAVGEHLGAEQERSDEARADGSVDVGQAGEGSAHTAGDTVGGGVERVREPSVLDRVQGELDDVEGALERLDAGSYGTCQTCGGEIDDERLAVVPATRFCREHDPS